MKKRGLACLLAALLLVTAFAGCSPQEQQTQANNGEKIKISFWLNWNNVDMKELIEEVYNKENPDNIEVEVRVVSSKYEDMINMAFLSNEAPDVFVSQNSGFAKNHVKAGHIADITSYVDEEYKNSFIDGAFRDNINVFDGKIYGLPNAIFTRKMLYNADLFREAGLDPDDPPSSWVEIKEAAEKITAIGNGEIYGLSLPIGDAGALRTCAIESPGLKSYGLINGWNPVEGKYEFEKYAPTLKLLREMYQENTLFPSSATLKQDQELVYFTAGKIGMCMMPSGKAQTMGISDDLKYDFDMRSTDLPCYEGEPEYYNSLEAVSAFLLSSTCENKDAAMKFMKWMQTPECMGELMKRGGDMGFSKEIYNQEEYISDAPAAELFLPDDSYEFFPPQPGGLTIEGDKPETVYANILLSDIDIDAAMADLTQRHTQALEKSIADGVNELEDYVYETNPMKIQ